PRRCSFRDTGGVSGVSSPHRWWLPILELIRIAPAEDHGPELVRLVPMVGILLFPPRPDAFWPRRGDSLEDLSWCEMISFEEIFQRLLIVLGSIPGLLDWRGRPPE